MTTFVTLIISNDQGSKVKSAYWPLDNYGGVVTVGG